MLSVAIHKDIAEYQPKVIGKLTGRTLISITVALGLAVRSQPLRDLPYVHNCRSLHPHAVRNNGTG